MNKADGLLLDAAKHTKADYAGAMHFIRQKSPHWRANVLLMSASTEAGLDVVEATISEFHKVMCDKGELLQKRAVQARMWMWSQLRRQAVSLIEAHPAVRALAGRLEEEVGRGRVTPVGAAAQLLALFLNPGAPGKSPPTTL